MNGFEGKQSHSYECRKLVKTRTTVLTLEIKTMNEFAKKHTFINVKQKSNDKNKDN